MSISLPRRSRHSAYPAGRPKIDWGNPTTRGLRGFVWVGGGGGPVDVVTPRIQWQQAGVTRVVGPRGPMSTASGASAGIYTPRMSLALGQWWDWALPVVPLTLMAYFDAQAASSAQVAGVIYGNTGYGFWALYGDRSRLASAYVGGVRRDAAGGVWDSGVGVRGMTASATQVCCYDNGTLRGQSTPYAASSLTYDGTYTRAILGGNPDSVAITLSGAYWMAVWARELSAGEMREVALTPFSLLCGGSRRTVLGAGALPPDALWLSATGQLVRAGSAGGNRRLQLLPSGALVAGAAAVPSATPLRVDAAGQWTT